MRQLEVPVIFIFFNRKQVTMETLEAIRAVKPRKLYLVSDGARIDRAGEAEVVTDLRKSVESYVDWECEIRKNYAESNMGCKQRVSTGISWVFSQEEMAVIVEDDVVALPSFFYFCEELLNKYKADKRIYCISGHKVYDNYAIEDSYIFSRHPNIWGWATWRRAWNEYNDDIEDWNKVKQSQAIENFYNDKVAKIYKSLLEKAYTGEVDTWDYIWTADVVKNNGLGIVPKTNLIKNIGFNDKDAAHTKGDSPYKFEREELEFPLIHPEEITRNEMYDKLALRQMERELQGPNIIARVIKKIKQKFCKK